LLSIPDSKTISKVFSHKNSFFSGNFSLYGTHSLRKQGESDENMEGKYYVRKLCLFYAFRTSCNEIIGEKSEFLLENRQSLIYLALFFAPRQVIQEKRQVTWEKMKPRESPELATV
jgi:hypothetical protein